MKNNNEPPIKEVSEEQLKRLSAWVSAMMTLITTRLTMAGLPCALDTSLMICCANGMHESSFFSGNGQVIELMRLRERAMEKLGNKEMVHILIMGVGKAAVQKNVEETGNEPEDLTDELLKQLTSFNDFTKGEIAEAIAMHEEAFKDYARDHETSDTAK